MLSISLQPRIRFLVAPHVMTFGADLFGHSLSVDVQFSDQVTAVSLPILKKINKLSSNPKTLKP